MVIEEKKKEVEKRRNRMDRNYNLKEKQKIEVGNTKLAKGVVYSFRVADAHARTERTNITQHARRVWKRKVERR